MISDEAGIQKILDDISTSASLYEIKWREASRNSPSTPRIEVKDYIPSEKALVAYIRGPQGREQVVHLIADENDAVVIRGLAKLMNGRIDRYFK